MPAATHLLLYEYVSDVLDRRAPHREAHLKHIAEWHDDGRLVVAGATGDPPNGAAFAFRVADADELDLFVQTDPYVRAGLVARSEIRPWTVVTG